MNSLPKITSVLITILIGLFTSFYSKANPALDKIGKDNVSIMISASNDLADFTIHTTIHNLTDNTISFSDLGDFGNAIHTLHPNGKISTFEVLRDLPSDFVYNPRHTIKAGGRLVFQESDSDSVNNASFLGSLLSTINTREDVGRYEIWFDLVDWVDFRGNKFHKYTSNRIVFYVGVDGNKVFINDPEAIQSFKEIGVEIGNSSADVRVERNDEGNYRLIDTADSNFFVNKVFSHFKTYSFIWWFALAIIMLLIAYYIWRFM